MTSGDGVLLGVLVAVAVGGLVWSGFSIGDALVLGILCGVFAWAFGHAAAP